MTFCLLLYKADNFCDFLFGVIQGRQLLLLSVSCYTRQTSFVTFCLLLYKGDNFCDFLFAVIQGRQL